MSIKVLVVEDDREIRGLLRSALAVEGFEVSTAVSVSEADGAAGARSARTSSCSTSACPTATARSCCARCAQERDCRSS